jgi:hypothetical protein
MQLKVFIFFFLFSLLFNFSFSQKNVSDETINTFLVSVNYGLNMPTKELSERFGLLNNLGLNIGYKTKRNWIIGIESNFYFGKDIKENNILDNLKDSYGNITDINGDVATILLFSRGYNGNASVSKLFPIFGYNTNSGLLLTTGVGFMAYKIRIESNNQVIPQVEVDYKKGYDRYTSGLCFNQFVGYSFMSNNGLVNFYTGFYFQQGFTTNQRDINFDSPDIPVDKSIRNDFLYGYKVGWVIPIYKRKPKDYYYN